MKKYLNSQTTRPMAWIGTLSVIFASLATGCAMEAGTDGSEAEPEDAADFDVEYADLQVFKDTNRKLIRDSEEELVDKVWGEDTDNSGKVRVRVYECSGYGQHVQVNCSVGEDEVVVGGGAWADYGNGPGALLTGSFPESNDLETWVGRSKDHNGGNAHTLRTYAIGMRLTGVDRATLKSKTILRTKTSGSAPHPGTSVSLPDGYTLIGGGARVNWTGNGNLLTESYPTNNTTWKVASKDHYGDSPATITAYAIGITTGTISGFGKLQIQQRSDSSSAAGGVATATRTPSSGWATTCAGGRSTHVDPGRLLFQMMPSENDEVITSSKDHQHGASGTVYAYLLEARKAP